MTISQPPRLAMWILKRFTTTAADEAVLGDLAEEYQRRQSSAWFWWQALAAIVVAARRDVGPHALVVPGAIVIGLTVIATPVLMLMSVAAASVPALPIPVWAQVLVTRLGLLGVVMFSGWLVTRLFRAHRALALLSLTFALLAVDVFVMPAAVDLSPLALVVTITTSTAAVLAGGLWKRGLA
jgi:hypothetical protein